MVKIGIPLKYSHLPDGRCILYLGEKVRRCFQKAGAFIIPIVQVQDVDYCDTKYNEFPEISEYEKKQIDDYLDLVDGVVLPGGFKITPYDKYLLQRCIDRDIPTLGICLGMQLMSNHDAYFNVFDNDSFINHFQENDNELSHDIMINKDSLLYKIIGKEKILVNSFHKKHVSGSTDYLITAKSDDDYIEAVELRGKKFNLGVQWHPEISYDFDDNSKRLIDYFINVCGEKND